MAPPPVELQADRPRGRCPAWGLWGPRDSAASRLCKGRQRTACRHVHVHVHAAAAELPALGPRDNGSCEAERGGRA